MDLEQARALTNEATSASICDAMARRHAHRCHAIGLLPARPGTVTAGFAATVRFGPRRDDMPDHDLAAAAERALADIPDGAVVVIGGPDAPDEAVAGGKKLAALEELGVAGVIAWAAIRDRAEAAGYEMGVWALHETPRASGDRLQIIEVGGIVTFGGVTVAPGDWVHVDSAGMVVVPAVDRDEVLQTAVEIEEADAAAVADIRRRGRQSRG
jgi:regulator of ribonuclease activity A